MIRASSPRTTKSAPRAARTLGSCLLLVLVLLLGVASTAAKVIEPRTKIAFDEKIQRAPLKTLGLRTKGPIKVYAVGQYGKSMFMLKMAFTVNAEKLSNALLDALKPRCGACEDHDVDDFKDMVMQALPDGAKKGTTLLFNTGGNKVTLTVNGKAQGKIVGKAVAQAFAGIYTDSNAVCQMKPVELNGGESGSSESKGGQRDPEVIQTLGVMAAATLIFILIMTKPDTSVRVFEINIYPVKSCAEQTVRSAKVTPRGFEGDRIAMVVDNKGKCCTSRDLNKAALFHVFPTFDADSNSLTLASESAFYPLQVDLAKTAPATNKITHNEAPGNLQLADYGNVAASWLETATHITGCRLTGISNDYQRKCLVNPDQGDALPTAGDIPVSLADEAPFLLTNEASLGDLNGRLLERGHAPVDMRRFRPNIVVNGSVDGIQPWQEDTWKKIRIGKNEHEGVDFFVWQRCGRCIMTTIDRDSLLRSAEPLATLNIFREGAHGQRNFGMHLIPDPATLMNRTHDGIIQVGDKVTVLEYDEERQKEWMENFGS